jgi:hypothetical protein
MKNVMLKKKTTVVIKYLDVHVSCKIDDAFLNRYRYIF